MKLWQQRLFILIDELVGGLILLYLHKTEDSSFWPFFIGWAITTYVVSYPLFYLASYREAKALKKLREEEKNGLFK